MCVCLLQSFHVANSISVKVKDVYLMICVCSCVCQCAWRVSVCLWVCEGDKEQSPYYRQRKNVSSLFFCIQLHFFLFLTNIRFLSPYKNKTRDIPSLLFLSGYSFCRLEPIVLYLGRILTVCLHAVHIQWIYVCARILCMLQCLCKYVRRILTFVCGSMKKL